MKILAITTMKDEAPFLLEWIAHYLNLGVSHFLIFTNDCSDGTDQMLDLLAAEGIVTHLRNEGSSDKTPQWYALHEAARHPLLKAHDWAMMIDVDEFATITPGAGRFVDLFDAIDTEFDAITMTWRFFGHSGRLKFIDEPITSQFQYSAKPGYCGVIGSLFFKTLYRVAGPFQKPRIHRPRNAPGRGVARWIDGCGRALPASFVEDEKRLSVGVNSVPGSLIELNHYSVKSAETFLLKRQRGLPSSRRKDVDLSYWVERNFNTVHNPSMARYLPSIIQKTQELRRVPKLGELHDRAVELHRNQIETLKQDLEHLYLLHRTMVAGGSVGFPSKHQAEFSALYMAAAARSKS